MRTLACTALAAVLAVAACAAYRTMTDDSRRHYLGASGWPSDGQAALRVGGGEAQVGPRQRAAPIASLAKVMTAYLVLHAHADASITVTAADVADTARRRARDESVVAVRAGERLSE